MVPVELYGKLRIHEVRTNTIATIFRRTDQFDLRRTLVACVIMINAH